MAWLDFRLPLVAVAVCCACSPPPDFTEAERALLAGYAIGAVPANPANRFADDAGAAAIGQQFFFDTRFSGPLAVGSDGANGATGRAGPPAPSPAPPATIPPGAAPTWLARQHQPRLLVDGTQRPERTQRRLVARQFWDGRRDSPGPRPLVRWSAGEHNFSRLEVAHLVRQVYRPQYEEVFGAMPDFSDASPFGPDRGKPGDPAWDQMARGDQDAVNRLYANFGKAIEALPAQSWVDPPISAFDCYLAGDTAALSPAAARLRRPAFFRRRRLLQTQCLLRSPPSATAASTTPAFRRSARRSPRTVRGSPEPDVPTSHGGSLHAAGAYSDASPARALQGLPSGAAFEATRGAFKTSPLRGVARTAPYMHTGAFPAPCETWSSSIATAAARADSKAPRTSPCSRSCSPIRMSTTWSPSSSR